MINCINIYIQTIVSNVTNSLVRNTREIAGMPEEKDNIQTLQDLKNSLIRVCEDGHLLMYLTGVSGTGKIHVIFTSCSFFKEISASLQALFTKYSFTII